MYYLVITKNPVSIGDAITNSINVEGIRRLYSSLSDAKKYAMILVGYVSIKYKIPYYISVVEADTCNCKVTVSDILLEMKTVEPQYSDVALSSDTIAANIGAQVTYVASDTIENFDVVVYDYTQAKYGTLTLVPYDSFSYTANVTGTELIKKYKINVITGKTQVGDVTINIS